MQSEEMRTVNVMVRKPHFQHLSERIIDFVVATIKATSRFPKSYAGNHISGQLIRSASSVGANYEEACTAQSKADFVHKTQIALKEIREANYWIKLATKLDMPDKVEWETVAQEAGELLLILAKSVATAKGVGR